MSISKNDIIKLKITAMSNEGLGIGRADNFVIFVKDSAVSDELYVKVLKVKKNLAYAKIESIISPSADRIEVDCPVSSKCGGCVYRHISYESELKIKRQKVIDAVTRIGKIDRSLVRDIIGSDKVDAYRNKAMIPIGLDSEGEVVMGFYANHSHRIVECINCKLSPEIFSKIAKDVFEFIKKRPHLASETSKNRIRHLYLRYAQSNKSVMVCFVTSGEDFEDRDILANSLVEKYPQIKSIVINSKYDDNNVILGKKCRTIYGDDYIFDTLCGLEFEISPLSFYQVNHGSAEKIYSIAREYAALGTEDTLLDLYCGTGTIGLSMAKGCKELIGVEIVEAAVENAKKNAEKNGIKNAEFLCMDAATAAKSLSQKGVSPDVVVIDPPRKGIDKALVSTIVEMSPKRVVYVSCDPATMARDVAIFESENYSVKEITPVDMFPRTAHVETVVLLSRARAES